jgi:hypothetical protein
MRTLNLEFARHVAGNEWTPSSPTCSTRRRGSVATPPTTRCCKSVLTMRTTTIGIDLVKDVFEMPCASGHDKPWAGIQSILSPRIWRPSAKSRVAAKKLFRKRLSESLVQVLTWLLAGALAACGSSVGTNGDSTAAAYTIGGNISGLAEGAQVTLQNNGANALTLSSNGAFVFTAPISAKGSYIVTVSSQPAGQICSVSGGTGTGLTANIGNVGISCSAQILSSVPNAIDRINFGDTGSDAYSESAHAFVDLGQPTGAGALGLTWREIAPSSVSANVGNAADNEVLTFTMACSPTLQNYLTIQVWGSDTIPDVIYLYTAAQGYLMSNYYATSTPEIDFQQATAMLPGRFVYETVPIPLSMTGGKTTVTLTLNAAQSYYYYASASTATTELPMGATSRPIYSAFTHTSPDLVVASTDPQGVAPSATVATPTTYNSAYFSTIQSSLTHYLSQAANHQAYGASWNAAVSAGTVPAQIIGYFDAGVSPSDSNTMAEWLNNAAINTSAGNNGQMQRLDMLAFAYVTPNFLASFYQDSTTEQEIVAALDAYSYMQSLNGCWGAMTAWNGVGATATSTSNPYGRTNAPCSALEGAGTWALGSAIVLMQNDPAFLAALNGNMNSSLEPGVPRYQAYQTMLVNHINFLTSSIGHGHSPNTDQLQATGYVYANLALRVLDRIYGTSLAQSNAAMYSNYLNVVAGLATNQYGGVWVSNDGLSLEFHGTGNGSYDGGYGWDGANYLVRLAKILNDNGIETAASHPVRTVAMNAVHAFSNFIYPSLTATSAGYVNTLREEEALTFRKNLNIGEVNAGTFYYAAAEFNDPYAIHAFYLEHANGIVEPMGQVSAWNDRPTLNGNLDSTVDNYLHWYADYATLCNMVNSQPTDPSGVTFLNEPAHGNGVWADPIGSTITIQNNGERLAMVLNWRPLMSLRNSGIPSAANEVVNNLARVHDTTATTDRIATIAMPSSTATGASGTYTSGSYGTLYIARYGNYLVALNQRSSAATMTLPPDMTQGSATDLVSGAAYDLTRTTTVAVPALGAVVLLQAQ